MAQRTEIGDLAIKISAQMDATVKAAIAETMKGFQGIEKSAEKTSRSIGGGIFGRTGLAGLTRMVSVAYAARVGLATLNLAIEAQKFNSIAASGGLTQLVNAQIRWTEAVADSIRIVPLLGGELARLYGYTAGIAALKEEAAALRDIGAAAQEAAKAVADSRKQTAKMELEAAGAPVSEKQRLEMEQNIAGRREREEGMLATIGQQKKLLMAARGEAELANRGIGGGIFGTGKHGAAKAIAASRKVMAYETEIDKLTANYRAYKADTERQVGLSQRIVTNTQKEEAESVAQHQFQLREQLRKATKEAADAQKEQRAARLAEQLKDAVVPPLASEIDRRNALRGIQTGLLDRRDKLRSELASMPEAPRYAAAMEKGSAEAYSAAYGNTRGQSIAERTARASERMLEELRAIERALSDTRGQINEIQVANF